MLRPMLLRRLIPLTLATFLLSQCASPIVGQKMTPKGTMQSGYTVRKNIVFTPQDWPAPVRGDLYRPTSQKHPGPGILLVHGGGWTGKDGRWQMDPIAKKLAKRGYVVMNVTYRLAPRWIYPAPVEDLKQALGWMRANAAETGMDPNRIAVFGYSAGGYLAALVGLDESMGIRAIVAGGSPSNLALYPGGDLVPQFLGGTKQEIPERFAEASPVNHVTPRSPPVFLYHGGADRLVPPEHAWEFASALQEQKISHELLWVEGRGHIATFLMPGRSVDEAIAFLDRELR